MTWSFPLAWSLLGLAPLIWWWHWRRREEPPVRVGSIELWTEDPTAPTAGQPTALRSWDAELWAKFFLLLLLTVAAAGPSFSPSSGLSSPGAALPFFALTRSPENPERLDWLVRVEWKGSAEEDLRVVLRHGGQVQDARSLGRGPDLVEENDSLAWVGGGLSAAAQQGTPWTATLEDAEGRALGRATVSEPAHPNWQAILVGGTDGWFLEQAISAISGWTVQRLDAEAAVRQLREQALPPRQVVFVLDALPPEQTEALLQLAPVWFWSVGPGGRGAPLSLPVATDQEAGHPVLRGIDFGWVTILQAHEIRPSPGWAEVEVLVQSPEGALLVAGGDRNDSFPTRGDVFWPRWLAVAFRLENSDLALRTEFPVLIQQGLHWLLQRDTFAETSVWSIPGNALSSASGASGLGNTGKGLAVVLLLGALLWLWLWLPPGLFGAWVDALLRGRRDDIR